MKYIITATMILVFGTMGYVSVKGLSSFLNMGILSYFIGVGLEMTKFCSIAHLHLNWRKAIKKEKFFYGFISFTIAILTLVEVGGYLTLNYTKSVHVADSANKEKAHFLETKEYFQDKINSIEHDLKELPHGYVKRKEETRNSKEYKYFESKITEMRDKLHGLSTSKEVKRAGGPVYALAGITGFNTDTIAQWFLFIIIVVWELSSMGLIILNNKAWETKPKTIYVPKPETEEIELKPRNQELVDLMKTNSWRVNDVLEITGRRLPETVEDWLKNISEIPIKSLKKLKRINGDE